MAYAGARYLLAAAALSQLASSTTSEGFDLFISKHGRTYKPGSAEHAQRAALFAKRAEEVKALNSRGQRLWTAAVNSFSDRTEEELSRLRGWRGYARGSFGSSSSAAAGSVRRHGLLLSQAARAKPLPQEFMNWTSLTSLGSFVDQGGCGSCWAVAGATTLSLHSEIYTAKTRSFSVQELVSCVPNPRACGGTGGCDGATVELAFQYAMRQGLATEDEDPYQGVTGTCQKSAALLEKRGGVADAADNEDEDLATPAVHMADAKAGGKSFGMIGWERLPENKYEPLMRAVVERGPVAISAAAQNWYAYYEGIFDDCPKDAVIDHAVTLLGFGFDTSLGQKYWLIQNSWGNDWGESGRIRLLRRDGEETEHCGTDFQPDQGTGCKGGPSQVKVCGMCGVLYDSVVPYFNSKKISA